MVAGEPVAASVAVIVTLLFAVAFATAIGGYVTWMVLRGQGARDSDTPRVTSEDVSNSTMVPIRRWALAIAGVILVAGGLVVLLDPDLG